MIRVASESKQTNIDRLKEFRNLLAGELQRNLHADLRKLELAIHPLLNTTETAQSIKPCWEWSYRVYLWVLKTLPHDTHDLIGRHSPDLTRVPSLSQAVIKRFCKWRHSKYCALAQ